jgi:hypothetical protein
MALPAELYLGVLQKPALRRRVGTVTIEAPVFSTTGRWSRFLASISLIVVVASLHKSKPFFFRARDSGVELSWQRLRLVGERRMGV